MQSTGKKELSKKILCSILAAGVLSVGGAQCVWAEELIATDKDITINEPAQNISIISEHTTEIHTDYSTNRFAGIAANGSGIDITANSLEVKNNAITGDEVALYGIDAITNNNISIKADTYVETISDYNAQARLIRSDAGGDILINGNVTGVAESNGGIVVAVEAWKGADITVNGNASFNLHTETGRIIGIQNHGNDGGKFSFNGDFDLTMSNGENQNQWNQGILANQSTTEFNGSTTDITFNNYSNISNFSDNGNNLVDIQCDQDKIPTIINFNSDVTNLNINSYGESKNQLIGLVASGTVGQANFNGDVANITINGNKSDFVAGLWAKYDGTITSSENNTLTINVKNNGFVNEHGSSESMTAGIYTQDYAKANGHILLNGNLNITANAVNGTAAGIVCQSMLEDYKGEVIVNGNVKINATSENGDGLGVYAKDDNKVVNLNGNVDIAAQSADGYVGVALLAQDGGVINVGSEGKTVSLKGMVQAEGGIINIYGDTIWHSDMNNALLASAYNDKDGEINLAGGNMSGQLYIQSGVVNLNGATFTTNDIANDITGGGKLVLKDSGVLYTTADQIFTNGENAVTATDKVDGILGSTADKVTFESGTVSLTDAEYTFDFVKSAVEAMGEHKYEGDKTSNTGIVMTGDLIGGIEDNKISVDDAASVGDDIALDKVTVEADNNLLVGAVVSGEQEIETITIKDSVTNGFNASNLDLKASDGSTAGMVITNDKNVTLGGSAGGYIITVNGAEPTGDGVRVVVGLDSGTNVDGVINNKGSFTIGNVLATSETEYTLNGSVTVNADSNLTTNGQTNITGGVTLNNGNLDAASGVLKADVAVKENTTNTITGTVNAGTLTGANGAVINVGTAEKTASTSIEDANLNGATICFDPAWDQEAGTHGIAFVDNVNTADVDGTVLIGRNNYVGVGTADSQAAKEMFAKTGLTFGKDDITAALYIAGNQTLDGTNGAIVVDGSKAGAGDFGTVSGGTFAAADNSVTMVDGQSIKDNAALSGVTTATIADSAKLYIDNAKNNETYRVINGVDTGWSMDNIISDNALLKFEDENNNDSAFNVTASYDKVDNVYGAGAVVIADVVDTTLDTKDEGDAAFDFFNAAANSKNNATKEAQVAAFNSAANMGEMGGVNHASYSVSNAMTDAVADHLSIATHGDQDKDIWAHYVHNKENIEGISLGGINADYDLQYNGIVVGSDLYKNGKATAGIALSYIEGDVTNSNIASNTKNEAEYYGASVYGRIDNGNSAVLGDITYMHGSSDITQQNSGYKLTADADTDVFSIGVRAEQKVEAGIGHFVPYAGLRYMHIGTGNYTNSIGMSYDVDEQNLWLLPVGVTYSCEAQKGDWTIRPVVEAGYVWAMGDRDTNQTVSLNGAADGFGFDTADSGSFISRFAVEAEKANVIYSLGYEYQKGDTVKANKWMANMTFTF